MRRLIVGLALVIGLLAAGYAQAAAAYDMRDVMPYGVKLPDGTKRGLMFVETGKWALPPQFEDVKRLYTGIIFGSDYLDDVLAVKVGGKWGVADKEGNIIVAPQYDAVVYKGEGLLLVVTGGVDYAGGLLPAIAGGKWGVLDRRGRVVIVPRFDDIGDFTDGLAVVKENGKYGYVDKTGRLVISPQYDQASGFCEGLAAVAVDGKYGFIDKSGKMVIEPQFEYQGVRDFSEGLAAVRVNGKWGYIDKTGAMVIAPQFAWTESFADGLAAVRPVRKAGFINRAGEMVVEPMFDDVASTKGAPTLGIIYENDFKITRCVFVGKSGKFITPWYEGAWAFSEGIAKVLVDGKVGFIDTLGKAVIEPEFSHASMHCQNGMVFVETGGKRGFRDSEGRWLARPVFGPSSTCLPRHKVVWDKGYIYDGGGNKLDHYANHMCDGFNYLAAGSFSEARAAFQAALRINLDDAAALYGLKQAEER